MGWMRAGYFTLTCYPMREVSKMSRFYASIQGNKGEATRQGTPNSGIIGHIRGWDIGGKVRCEVENDKDVVYFYLTSGGCTIFFFLILLTGL